MALSKRYREQQNRRRKALLKKLVDGDPKFVDELLLFASVTDDNKQIKHFGLGKTSDGLNMHRKNLRALRLKRNKKSAADIAWGLESVGFDCPIKDVTREEWESFLRMTTLLYSILEIYG